MPVSAYLRATVLLIAAAAALFGSAGSLAIPTFWVYWAILVTVFVAAFALLDRGLLQERMRPGGRPTRTTPSQRRPGDPLDYRRA
jgi:hypothetical protein